MLIGSNARLSGINSITSLADVKHIDDAQSFTCLGLVIIKILRWEDHVDYMCHTINKKRDRGNSTLMAEDL